jgi:hypothetical protein
MSDWAWALVAKVAVTLVHREATLQVPGKVFISKCDLFRGDPTLAAFPYHLKSEVSLSDFREFVSALSGITVKVRNNEVKALSQLCQKSFVSEIWQHSFRNSGLPKISRKAPKLKSQSQ